MKRPFPFRLGYPGSFALALALISETANAELDSFVVLVHDLTQLNRTKCSMPASFVKDGPFQLSRPDGSKCIEGRFDRGIPVGHWAFYVENALVMSADLDDKGRVDGIIEVRTPELFAEMSFSHDVEEGLSRAVMVDGSICTSTWVAGKLRQASCTDPGAPVITKR